jgi:uncharacterized protein (DUF433 family)
MKEQNRIKLLERITVNPEVMVGKPTVRNTRMTVEHILTAYASGLSFVDLQDDYPFLEFEDVQACLIYAAMV